MLTIVALMFGAFSFTSFQTDGVATAAEWKDAQENALGDGNKMLIKRDKDNNILHVALKGKQLFWAHFYLSDGKTVKVMHASAALGAIEYINNNSVWTTDDESFVYELRDQTFTDETSKKMDEYFLKNGWVANNNNLGDKRTIEARFDLRGFNAKYFACVMATPAKLYPHPAGLRDDVVKEKLVQGYAVDSLTFEPRLWRDLR